MTAMCRPCCAGASQATGKEVAVETGTHLPRLLIDTVEVVEETDDLAFDHLGSAIEERLVVPRPRRRDETRRVDCLDNALRAGGMVGYALYPDRHLTSENRRRVQRNTLPLEGLRGELGRPGV